MNPISPFDAIRLMFLTGGGALAETVHDPMVGPSEDSKAEKSKVGSLKRKFMSQGLSAEKALAKAIAILKSRGAISKKYGNDGLSGRLREELIRQTMDVHGLSREEAIAFLQNIHLDKCKKKKKKQKP